VKKLIYKIANVIGMKTDEYDDYDVIFYIVTSLVLVWSTLLFVILFLLYGVAQ
jgi:hypothetical protein